MFSVTLNKVMAKWKNVQTAVFLYNILYIFNHFSNIFIRIIFLALYFICLIEYSNVEYMYRMYRTIGSNRVKVATTVWNYLKI